MRHGIKLNHSATIVRHGLTTNHSAVVRAGR
jgi:hypothetical protein